MKLCTHLQTLLTPPTHPNMETQIDKFKVVVETTWRLQNFIFTNNRHFVPQYMPNVFPATALERNEGGRGGDLHALTLDNKQQERMHRGRCDVTFSTADVAMKVQSKIGFSRSLKKLNIVFCCFREKREHSCFSKSVNNASQKKNTHQQCMCSYE